MSSRRPSPSPAKRTTALKRVDGEPLTRFDIQYDVLYNIFHDTHAVFTDPYSSDTLAPKITFRDLYLTTISHSPKATKALKDKMSDSEMFSEDFAMLALLVNVGRINTTMSFFPEMKTAIRTYHPIPALQRTTGNLQDAPRIKHILKSSALKDDIGNAPSTPADILSRVKSGRVPSTTVMNLIFVFANHSTPIGHLHFSDKIDFIDLFTRENVSSLSRAQGFLWLCYHYLESVVEDNDDDYDGDGPTNPFAVSSRGNSPTFMFLAEHEILQENIDPDEEKALADKLVAQRLEILKTQGAKELSKQNKTSGAGSSATKDTEAQFTKKNHSDTKRATGKPQTSAIKEKKTSSIAARGPRRKDATSRDQETFSSSHIHESDDEYAFNDPTTASNRYPQPNHHQPKIWESREPHSMSSLTPESRRGVRQHRRHRYSPYPLSPKMSQAPSRLRARYRERSSTPPPPRSMLEQAWHIVMTTDPLLDSDEEGADEHLRYDYIRRLEVINTLRCKEPTPEPEYYSPHGPHD